MRKQIKTTEAIFPMPVLMIATYNEDGSVDVMNAAWGMMLDRKEVVLNLTETHKTVKNIKERGAFTVSIADADHVIEADYLGITSGNTTPDKFEKSGLTATRSDYVDAPIVNVTADEKVMSGDTVDVSLLNAIAFDPYTHGYYKVTERVGEAFKDGEKIK